MTNRISRRDFLKTTVASGIGMAVLPGLVKGGNAMEETSVSKSTMRSIATFQADVTPPLGSPLCGGGVAPAKKIVDPLSARGVVIFTDDLPIVLCAVDWVLLNNAGYDEWRSALADAAGTTVQRVSVNTLHQHDTPGCDFLVEKLLAEHGVGGIMFDVDSARDAIAGTAKAVKDATEKPQKVTHIGMGKGKVEKFASNRRILGPDGKVQYVRYTACQIPEAIAAPEGVIDPYVWNLSFWNGDRAIASLTYYATHPQSFYGKGAVSYDTVGIARGLRDATLPDVAHIHFNGAGSNIGAGKYNDGSPRNRLILARRLAEGMEAAWKDMVKVPVEENDLEWRVRPVALPLRKSLIDEEESTRKTLDNPEAKTWERSYAGWRLVWLDRCRSGHKIELNSLRVGPAYVLHMPGELFVEYQLAAQKMRPDNMVCMAAYADCGMGYIGTEVAYSEGGYETSGASRTAPEVESVLMDGMRELLGVKSDQ